MLNEINRFFFSLPKALSFSIVLFVMVVFSFFAYKRKQLTMNGVIGAFAVGFTIFWCLGPLGFMLLLFFYASSYAIHHYIKSRLQNRIKKDECNEKKSNTRDMMQVFANAFMAIICALYYYNTLSSAALVVFGAVIAEAAADTWAGEIGRLSVRPPFSIRTFEPVPRGMSGGVTPLGFCAGFAGSVLTGAVWLLFFKTQYAFLSFSIIVLAGFAGCVADSYLGATFQAIYVDDEKNALTEEDTDSNGKKRTLYRGMPWLDNDIVNLMSNIFSALFALVLCRGL